MLRAKKVLIVEDEISISDIVKFNLQKEGYEVDTAYNGEEGLNKATSGMFDLVLLDIMLPLMDGFQVCRKVRETSTVPVIMMTAKEEEVDKVLGLELGADDYITKPFSMRELIARVKANIRRTEFSNEADSSAGGGKVSTYGELTIDKTKYEVRKQGNVLELTLREFELLKYMAEQENQVFSREQLLEEVWGYEYYGDIRTVDVTIRRLREKVENDPGKPEYIMTKRGIGYFFKRP